MLKHESFLGLSWLENIAREKGFMLYKTFGSVAGGIAPQILYFTG